ncbi:hypothetical protein OZX73_05320 [Bifidobacterium sp. ESL0775]|uniref:hypothetical protein n=1 Tax=Bifidobacterium sp. ESL0775 TaxID=2983230 RepID=UPI0023FA01C0|nr:hypothetical protein [Bifidobacterium sp. ESL0775]WEV68712.1 hypothetical protein OZX73_05320 [Bifidobacterium sp. ESL0775]
MVEYSKPLENLKPLMVHAYSAVTGGHLTRLPFTSCSWSDSINEPGQLSVEIGFNATARDLRIDDEDMHAALRPWRVILAVQRGQHVIHAGVATSRAWDAESRKLTFTCGGGWTLLGKRLVLNHGLDSSFADGDVLVDEDHPIGDWGLTLTGSYRDLARGLIAETLKWGELPFSLPPLEGGSYTRTYGGYDLATTGDRLRDLSELDAAMEYRFTPTLDAGGRLSYSLEAAHELVDHELNLNAAVPGQHVKLDSVAEDGTPLTSEVWASGGKDDDKTVMARATIPPQYRDPGMPFLQSTNTEHTTVSDISTLRTYARSQASTGAWPDETYSVRIGAEYDPHVGDHLDLRVEDDYLSDRKLRLKVTDVSGSSDSDWLTVQARERG